ncbi:MAG: hypothetical protein DRO67_00040 [Candidatus Asgardarchaeum californiense]|nr:MAG: hypothetical protein DRO67_00040 [Candidatus Asgardarchaeum californiense]
MFVEKTWWYKGYQCSVVQNMFGHRCGYVVVSIDTKIPMSTSEDYSYVDINVHGGVTLYEDIVMPMGTRARLGGVVISDGMRVLGFDCGHFYDKPDIEAAERRGMYTHGIHLQNGVVRTQSYCEAECRKMVDQIKEFNK